MIGNMTLGEWHELTPDERIDALESRIKLLEARVKSLMEREKLEVEEDGPDLA